LLHRTAEHDDAVDLLGQHGRWEAVLDRDHEPRPDRQDGDHNQRQGDAAQQPSAEPAVAE
jgi:hypothetical protein